MPILWRYALPDGASGMRYSLSRYVRVTSHAKAPRGLAFPICASRLDLHQSNFIGCFH
jgi:hypothetical protein